MRNMPSRVNTPTRVGLCWRANNPLERLLTVSCGGAFVDVRRHSVFAGLAMTRYSSSLGNRHAVW
jgi:hypothetical protein